MSSKTFQSRPLYFLILLSFGHLVVDMHSGGLPLLFPFFQDAYGLTYAQLGTLMLVSQISSSVIQPAFGIVSDRISTRFVMPVSLLITSAGLITIAFATTYPGVMAGVIVMGMGIAAYHPESSKLVHEVGGDHKGRAMSIFALGGNIGLAMGPLLVGLSAATFGVKSALIYVPVTLIAVILIQRSLHSMYAKATAPSTAPAADMAAADVARGSTSALSIPPEEDTSTHVDIPDNLTQRAISRTAWRAMILLLLAIVVRSGINAAMMTFIPLYYTNVLGSTTAYSSMLLTGFLMAGAAGTLVGGPLSDRMSSKKLISGSLLLSAPLIAFIPLVALSGLTFPLIIVAGFILISSFAVTTVYGQLLLPNNIGLASGLTLGISVGTGGLTVLPLGWIGDLWGLPIAFYVMAAMTLVGGLLALRLPNVSRAE